jgi:hypothetical protein
MHIWGRRFRLLPVRVKSIWCRQLLQGRVKRNWLLLDRQFCYRQLLHHREQRRSLQQRGISLRDRITAYLTTVGTASLLMFDHYRQ